MRTYLSSEEKPYMVNRGEYILTERLHGDYEGKLHISEIDTSLQRLRNRRAEIIRLRIEKPLFGPPPPKEEVARDLEIWQKQ